MLAVTQKKVLAYFSKIDISKFQAITHKKCNSQLLLLHQQQRNMAEKSSPQLPPAPKPPAEEDCCHSDCMLCVKDIYEQEKKIWEEECRAILLKQAPRSTMTPELYSKCTLLDIKPETHNSNLYTFDCHGFIDMKAGQHLILRELTDNGSLTRQYTPVHLPNANSFTFQVLIKLYESGSMSELIRKRWCVGYKADWRGPHGLFLHHPSKFTKYLMLAAGTGCAPMVNVTRSIVEDERDITNIKLFYANKTYEDIVFRSELKELSQYWNFTLKHFISQDEDAVNKKGYSENVACRRISKEDIQAELSSLSSTRVLVCGTKSFDNSMLQTLKDLGLPNENMFKF